MQVSNVYNNLRFSDDWLKNIETPAFIYDEVEIERLLDLGNRVREQSSCKVLFSLKPFSFYDALAKMAPRLDGFAVSSLFEARLASQIIGSGSVHITTPGIRSDETADIGTICNFISFNSLPQWDMYHEELKIHLSCGLRVNPQLSFVDDQRYDPCRPYSKLGVPLADLVTVATRDPERLSGVEGIHVHSNCESTNFTELLATVTHLHDYLGNLLQRVKWINLGGGYLLDDSEDLTPFYEAVEFLRANYGLQVFIEPGSAFIQSAGYIVSTVLDVYQSGDAKIAVLDTTVNHMPEVFEYGYEPDVIGHDDDAAFEYILAGCTCLAGDVFGVYGFDRPLKVGGRIIFYNVGAYTLSKAHMFNGVNLPAIYALTEAGDLVLKQRFTYADFAAKWGANARINH